MWPWISLGYLEPICLIPQLGWQTSFISGGTNGQKLARSLTHSLGVLLGHLLQMQILAIQLGTSQAAPLPCKHMPRVLSGSFSFLPRPPHSPISLPFFLLPLSPTSLFLPFHPPSLSAPPSSPSFPLSHSLPSLNSIPVPSVSEREHPLLLVIYLFLFYVYEYTVNVFRCPRRG